MKYARAKQNKKNKTISIVTILAGLLVISAITAFTLRRNGDNLNVLDGSGLGNAEETYTYIPDEEIVTQKLIGEEFTFEPNNDTSGKLAYKFNSITAYDNMYDLAGLELKENLEKSSRAGCDRQQIRMYDENLDKKVYIFDTNTGKLMDGYYIFVFEIEITNINATSTRYSNKPYLFNLSGMFYLVNRSGEKPDYGNLAYFKEEPNEEDNGYCSYRYEIYPGETQTLHFGFLLKEDESEKSFSRMGLADEGHTSTYDDNTIFYWFDMSDIISDMKNKQAEETE